MNRLLVCYFDGCCEPTNPGGNMGIGAIVLDGEEILFKHSAFSEASNGNSNNVAEYLALHSLLDFLIKEGLNERDILIRGDSKLAISQIKGEWKIKQGHYVPLAHEARRKKEKFPNTRFEWIPREMNSKADELSKHHLIEKGIEFKIQPKY